MRKIQEIVLNGKCTGCYSCMESCGIGAITMSYNEEGARIPYIDHEKCVDCGKCDSSCPCLNELEKDTIDIKVYAAQAEEPIRRVSSSGGLFSVIADDFLSGGGMWLALNLERI